MGEVVDILGTNGYYGWYTKVSDLYDFTLKDETDGKVEVEIADVESVHTVLKIIEEKVPRDVPLLLTEFGADSVPGYHSSAADLWSEEYHEKVIAEMIKASRKHNRVVGTFVFSFVDYIDPCKPLNGWWKDCNFKGMHL